MRLQRRICPQRSPRIVFLCNTVLLLLLSCLLGITASIAGIRLLLFVLRVEPDSNGGQIVESVGVGRKRTLQSQTSCSIYQAGITDARWWRNGRRRAVSDGERSASNRRQVMRVLGAYQNPSNNQTSI